MKELEDLRASVNSIFDDIQTAENIIAAFANHKKEKLDKNFMLFMRSDYLTTQLLYIKHCEEIAWRIVRDEDTRPATNAELLNLTSSASSHTKFNADGTLVFDALFTKVMGKDSPAKGLYPEKYPGYTDKLIEELREKYTIKERKLA